MEQPAVTVAAAPGAVIAVLVTTQVHPVSLIIVELPTVMLANNTSLSSEDIGSCQIE